MLNNVQQSKYISDTISIVLSFADLLSPGDTISGVPVITVTVSSGVDSNPSNLLYEGVSVTQGSIVEQRFRLGVPGVIYHILYSVVTVAGETLEKDTLLAILPEGTDVTPTWMPLWETTQLYPYEYGPESFISYHVLTSGRLHQGLYAIPPEGIITRQSLLSGTLTYQNTVTYVIPPESYKATQVLISGTLTYQNTVTYVIPPESIKTYHILISGTLEGSGVSYAIPYESFKATHILTGGTLT